MTIYKSVLHPSNGMGAVFEDDGETGYFYLWDENATDEMKIRGALRIYNSPKELAKEDVDVRLNSAGTKAGLFIHDVLWAVWDLQNATSTGGDYVPTGLPDPLTLGKAFD